MNKWKDEKWKKKLYAQNAMNLKWNEAQRQHAVEAQILDWVDWMATQI